MKPEALGQRQPVPLPAGGDGGCDEQNGDDAEADGGDANVRKHEKPFRKLNAARKRRSAAAARWRSPERVIGAAAGPNPYLT
jgi:hypothetical protein